MRSLPVLLLLLPMAACSSLSPDEQQQIASFQRNAGLYFEGGKYDQALGLIDRGLEIDASDYKLRTLRGSIFLRLSGPAAGDDQRLLDQSLQQFEDVYGDRSPSKHDRGLLFYYALARQKQSMRLLAAANHVDPKAEDSADTAAELRRRADDELDAARSLLGQLLDRGELPRLCHYHLLQIAALTNDTKSILEHGRAYLDAATKDQEKTQAEIEKTTVYGYELDQKRVFEAMRAEEINVRTLLAQQLYAQRDYAAALPHVDAVLRLDPTRSEEHYNRGLILRELGRVDEAKSDMRAFLATTTLPKDSPKVADAVRALAR